MKDTNSSGLIGFIVGIAIVVYIWFIVAGIAEDSKVRTGFLTHNNKTYTVELYDTLDAPSSVD